MIRDMFHAFLGVFAFVLVLVLIVALIAWREDRNHNKPHPNTTWRTLRG